VCQVFELGEIEGSYYLAMEYLEGVPLSCFRRHDGGGALPDPRLVAGIAIQACEGLHHAHQLKNSEGRPMELVHRDVSPQNLFVTVDGIVKVLDFGIAKVQDATVRTSTGAVKGTYAYMAPEQLRGERVDRRIDVFALGIAMWETLARRHLSAVSSATAAGPATVTSRARSRSQSSMRMARSSAGSRSSPPGQTTPARWSAAASCAGAPAGRARSAMASTTAGMHRRRRST
jgi:serine/threonine protein kinase